jgi:hypothetical protein
MVTAKTQIIQGILANQLKYRWRLLQVIRAANDELSKDVNRDRILLTYYMTIFRNDPFLLIKVKFNDEQIMSQNQYSLIVVSSPFTNRNSLKGNVSQW